MSLAINLAKNTMMMIARIIQALKCCLNAKNIVQPSETPIPDVEERNFGGLGLESYRRVSLLSLILSCSSIPFCFVTQHFYVNRQSLGYIKILKSCSLFLGRIKHPIWQSSLKLILWWECFPRCHASAAWIKFGC